MSKFWGLLDLSSHLSNQKQKSDRRAYERFSLPGILDACINHENSDEGVEVFDLSYDGFRISSNHLDSERLDDGSLTVIFNYLGHSAPLRAKLVNPSTKWSGFQFLHDTPDSLLELRNILEPLRKGNSMAQINSNGSVWSNNRALFRGDGPTEVTLVRTGQGDILFGSVLINESDFITEVALESGEVTINKGAVKLGRVSSKTLAEKFSSADILRGAIIILSQMHCPEIDAMKSNMITRLKSKLAAEIKSDQKNHAA